MLRVIGGCNLFIGFGFGGRRFLGQEVPVDVLVEVGVVMLVLMAVMRLACCVDVVPELVVCLVFLIVRVLIVAIGDVFICALGLELRHNRDNVLHSGIGQLYV